MKADSISFFVARRMIAASVLDRRQLAYAEVHHLPLRLSRACESLSYFVHWILGQLEVPIAVIVENDDFGDATQELRNELLAVLAKECVPVWRVQEQDLLNAYAIPACKTRRELEQIALSFWPFLEGSRQMVATLPALAGLYVHVEKLLTPTDT